MSLLTASGNWRNWISLSAVSKPVIGVSERLNDCNEVFGTMRNKSQKSEPTPTDENWSEEEFFSAFRSKLI